MHKQVLAQMLVDESQLPSGTGRVFRLRTPVLSPTALQGAQSISVVFVSAAAAVVKAQVNIDAVQLRLLTGEDALATTTSATAAPDTTTTITTNDNTPASSTST